ncbi:MAG: ribonuclease HII [Bacteriovoracaceae bacterium]|jgi:ribonuclease HII|nr:ribonuclease HII [Bacteriovoracaceae bacterium]
MEDIKYLKNNHEFLAGCDEVGRGPLAGPVVAGCFYLNRTKRNKLESEKLFLQLEGIGIDDSKKLTAANRKDLLERLAIIIEDIQPNKKYTFQDEALSDLSFAIVEIQHDEIDKMNILQASLKAMGDSLKLLHTNNEHGQLLIDGNKKCNFHDKNVEEIPLVKGDQRSILIALASIVAKEYRDQLMGNYAKKYPAYGFETHAGYPTKKHKEAIAENGICPIHRRSFKGVKEFTTKERSQKRA